MSQNFSQSSKLLGSITRDPNYVRQLQGLDEPQRGRDWDSRFTTSKIPQYDAVNDRFCKFAARRRSNSRHRKPPPKQGAGIFAVQAQQPREWGTPTPPPAPPGSAPAGGAVAAATILHGRPLLQRPLGAVGAELAIQTVPGPTKVGSVRQQPSHADSPAGVAAQQQPPPGQSLDTMFAKGRQRLARLWDELGVPDAERLRFAQHALTAPTLENVQTINDEIQRLLDRRNAAVQVEKAVEVREGFMYLLQELAERYASSPMDKDRAIRELNALVTPFRNSTLDVMDAIRRWRDAHAQAQPPGAAPPPYLWKGVSYLHKVNSDLFFLVHSRLGQLLEFELRNNPLLDPRRLIEAPSGTGIGIGTGTGGRLPPLRRAKDVAKDLPKERMDAAERMLVEEARRQQQLVAARAADPALPASHAAVFVDEEAQLAQLATEAEEQEQLTIEEDAWLQRQQKDASAPGREAAAATRIQTAYRGFVARKYVRARLMQRIAVIRMQTAARQFLAKLRARRLRTQVCAARRLQALQRGIMTRMRIDRVRRQHHAATDIQRVWRGHAARRYGELLAFVRFSAVQIQRMWRGHRARQRVRRILCEGRDLAATAIQRRWRGFNVRRDPAHSRKKIAAVVKIQALVRGILDRTFASERRAERAAAVRIQTWYRMLRAMREADRRRCAQIDMTWEAHIALAEAAAARIQAFWRMVGARRRCAELRAARDDTLAAEARRRLEEDAAYERRAEHHRHSCATRIQSVFRGFCGRRQVRMVRMLHFFATQIQRIVRGMIGRRRAGAARVELFESLHALSRVNLSPVQSPLSLIQESLRTADHSYTADGAGAAEVEAEVEADAAQSMSNAQLSHTDDAVGLIFSEVAPELPSAEESAGLRGPEEQELAADSSSLGCGEKDAANQEQQDPVMGAAVEEESASETLKQPDAGCSAAATATATAATTSVDAGEQGAQCVADVDAEHDMSSAATAALSVSNGAEQGELPEAAQEPQAAAIAEDPAEVADLEEIPTPGGSDAADEATDDAREMEAAAAAQEETAAAEAIQRWWRTRCAGKLAAAARRRHREHGRAVAGLLAARLEADAAATLVQRHLCGLHRARIARRLRAAAAAAGGIAALKQERAAATLLLQGLAKIAAAKSVRARRLRARHAREHREATREREAAALRLQAFGRQCVARRAMAEAQTWFEQRVSAVAWQQERGFAATRIQALGRAAAARAEVVKLREWRAIVAASAELTAVRQEAALATESTAVVVEAVGESAPVPACTPQSPPATPSSDTDEDSRRRDRRASLQNMHIHFASSVPSEDVETEHKIYPKDEQLPPPARDSDTTPVKAEAEPGGSDTEAVAKAEAAAAAAESGSPHVRFAADIDASRPRRAYPPDADIAIVAAASDSASASNSASDSASDSHDPREHASAEMVVEAAEQAAATAAVKEEVVVVEEVVEALDNSAPTDAAPSSDLPAPPAPPADAAALLEQFVQLQRQLEESHAEMQHALRAEMPTAGAAPAAEEAAEDAAVVEPDATAEAAAGEEPPAAPALPSETAATEPAEGPSETVPELGGGPTRVAQEQAADVRAALPQLPIEHLQALLRAVLSTDLVIGTWQRALRRSVKQRRETAVRKIQRCVRGYVAKCRAAHRRAERLAALHAANIAAEAEVEAAARAEAERVEAQRAADVLARCNAAAMRIQCAYRCYNARFMLRWKREARRERRAAHAEAERQRQQGAAATRIQCAVRCHRARMQASRRRAEHHTLSHSARLEEAQRNAAATRIQCAYRCFNARFEANWRREDLARSQARAEAARREREAEALRAIAAKRGDKERAMVEARAATRIQCAYRCFNARFELRWRREARAARSFEVNAGRLSRAAQPVGRGFVARWQLRLRQAQLRNAALIATEEGRLADAQADTVIDAALRLRAREDPSL